MKILFILPFLVLPALTSVGQKTINQKNIVQTLSFDFLEGCETGKGDCKPIQIIRQNKQDSIFLIFPSGGTISNVYLRSIKNSNLELHNKKLAGQGNPILNLTSLEDGEYYANIISCGLGGSCLIRIKTTF